MANLGYTARVGIVILIALGVFCGVVIFLKGAIWANRTYTIHVLFADASGVAKGVDVTMAGVKIGTVDKVALTKDLRADLTLSIDKRRSIPMGSRFIIAVPALGDVGVLTVVPPPGAVAQENPIPAGAVVDHGEQEADMASALNHANALMDDFRGTVRKINLLLDQTTALVGDQTMQKGIHASLANLQQASRNSVILTQDMNQALVQDNAQVQAMLAETRGGTKAALGNITATTADIRTLAHQNRAGINEIVANLRDTTSAIEGITSQTNEMLKEGGVTKNLSAITANLSQTTQKLNAIAGNLQQLTSDQSMQGDLKATVHNLRVTTEQTGYLVERVNHLLGVKNHEAGASNPKKSTPLSPSGTPPPGQAPVILPRVDMLQNVRDHRFRTDVDAFVPFGTGANFGQVGIFGVGDANKLDLEYGTLAPAGSLFDYRLGLHASKLGLGADWGLGHNQSISADLYDPNHGHLDVHGTWMLNPNVGLLLGGDDLTKRSSAVVGVEIRR